MTSTNKTIQINEGPGKRFTVINMIIFQTVFYVAVLLLVYGIFTLNLKLLLFLALVSLVQGMASRSSIYINYVVKTINPWQYLKKFVRIMEQDIPDNESTMYGFHPHSIYIYGILANLNVDNSKMSSMVALSSRFMLNFPFIGGLLRLWGVQSVDKSNFLNLIKQKKDIGIVPGGFEEATLTTPKQLRVFIKNRKGFIKYALQNGYTVRPVLIFNQHKAYKTLDGFLKLRLFFNKLKLPGVCYWGGDYILYFPDNVQMITIVGRGIKRGKERKGEVEASQIDQAHEEYIEQIKRIHAKYQNEYGEAPLVLY